MSEEVYSDSLSEALGRLQREKRGKGRLPDPPDREGLPADQATASPAGGGNASGYVSPLTQVSAGSTMLRKISSDGFLVYEYPETVTYEDAEGRELVFVRG